MPRRRTKSRDRIEQDFLDAVERLKAGRPQNPELREKLSKGKTVKINFATIAQEAARARGLISKENCRYPEVRQIALLEMGETSNSRDDVITNLRAQVAELRVQLKQAEAHAAYHFALRTKAEKDAAFKQKYEQLKAKVIAEQRRQRAASGNVVPLFTEDTKDAE